MKQEQFIRAQELTQKIGGLQYSLQHVSDTIISHLKHANVSEATRVEILQLISDDLLRQIGALQAEFDKL